jgi:SAM-dependent methyltransferase
LAEARDVKPWDLEWTPEHVQRYWDWFSTNPDLTNTYFSQQSGDDVLAQAARVISLRGLLADLGCGPGHLLDKALDRGLSATGCDSSAHSLGVAEKRLAGRPGFQGVQRTLGGRVPFADGSADLVTVIETVEHVPDPVLGALLAEAFRVTRPGGHVIVTTPNDEALGASKVMCPDCGCVFHQFQHVRTFTAASLAGHLEAAGFRTVHCRALTFSAFPPVFRQMHRLVFRLLKRPLANLLYVGRRPGP